MRAVLRLRRVSGTAVVAVVALLAAAACGTTVEGGARAGENPQANGTGSGTFAGDAGTAADGPRADGPDSPLGDGGAGTGAAATGSTTTGLGGNGGGAPVPGVTPRGSTSGTVTIGIEYLDAAGGAVAAAALGANGSAAAGDQKAAYQVLINELNRRGGLNGRKIVPVWFAYDPAGDNASTQDQSMCARFTQDNKVHAALLLNINTSTARTCLQKAGAIMVHPSDGSTFDDETLRQYPWYTTSGAPSWTRAARAYVDGLAQQGFFAKNARIGLITADDPAFTRTADGSLRAALRRHGLRVAEEYRIPAGTALADAGPIGAAVQNAVLKFQTAQITHVLFLQSNSSGAFFFMTAADKQGYKPRYGFSSNDEYAKLEANAPHDQMAGSLGVGWFPLADLLTGSNQISAAGRACLQKLRAAGNNPPDHTATVFALMICDQMAVFAAATTAGGTVLSPAAYLRGLESLGGSLSPAAVLGLRYGAGRRDGLSQARHVAYVSSCSCFRYTGAPYPI